MTWSDGAWFTIDRVHQSLPEDATLEQRVKALKDAAWGFHGGTSWGQKVWQRARREYLAKYGYRPKTGKQAEALPLLSPLDRMYQKAGVK